MAPPTRGLLLRFGVSALVGVVVAVGIGAVSARTEIVSTASDGPSIALTTEAGAPVAFGLQRTEPVSLAQQPATATIQLTSFHAAAPSAAPGAPSGPGSPAQPAWWDASTPRIPAITQFDGGPLQNVNCLLASGAMLARLGYGIVTTGSQLRALQDDQDGGTNHVQLQAAVGRGWGVRFMTGALTPLQLRALLYAGAGAVIGGIYGELPTDIRLSPRFTGSHSVYIDAFRPPGPDGPAAYYVIDPIGRTWQGYKGGWWPAEDVERFAMALLGGRIYTAWTFPGGVVPADHPILPPDAYPGTPTPSGSPRPGESPGPSPSSPTASPVVDPMPVGDLPAPEVDVIGEPPGTEPRFPDFHFESHVFELIEPDLRRCLAQPPPSGCPRGILGVIDLAGLTAAGPSPPPADRIQFLYAGAIAPDTYQVILEPPPDTRSALWFWDSAGGGDLRAATVESGMLDGRTVAIATMPLDPGATYAFFATASGDGLRALSAVGEVTVGP